MSTSTSTSRSALAFAIACLSVGCASGPLIRQAAAMNTRGAVLLAHGDLESAEAAFHVAIEYNDRYSEPHNNLGLVALRRDRIAEARAHFRAAISRNRDFGEAWSNLGVALARTDPRDRTAARDVREAERAFREALSINPGLTEPRFNLVRSLLARGDATEALTQARRLVQVADRSALAHALRAAAALDRGLLDEAVAAVREARERDADDADVSLVNARVLLVRGEVDEAHEMLVALATDARLGGEAHALLAAIYTAVGRRDDAAREIAAMGDLARDHPVIRRLATR